jgi:hypothetical protein
MRAHLAKRQKEHLIERDTWWSSPRTRKAKVKLHQPKISPRWARGAVSGALTDVGISNDFVKGFAKGFKPGCSALFLLVRRATGGKVLAGLSEFKGKGKLLQTSLTKDKEEALREAIEGATLPHAVSSVPPRRGPRGGSDS